MKKYFLDFFFQEMALSAAERQRRRRQRIAEDPDLHAEVKARERRRWAARKAAGKIVSANELSGRFFRVVILWMQVPSSAHSMTSHQ